MRKPAGNQGNFQSHDDRFPVSSPPKRGEETKPEARRAAGDWQGGGGSNPPVRSPRDRARKSACTENGFGGGGYGRQAEHGGLGARIVRALTRLVGVGGGELSYTPLIRHMEPRIKACGMTRTQAKRVTREVIRALEEFGIDCRR